MLDACDRLGMLVMDETFDMWTHTKCDNDYGLYFPDWWERDVEAMVHKDFNLSLIHIWSLRLHATAHRTPLRERPIFFGNRC